jgi:hypothetical protein
MKKYFKILTLICLTISAVSCKKGFLEESSQDLVRPTTTAALNQLMTGEAYALSTAAPLNNFLDLLTDDIQSNYNANTAIVVGINKYAPVFTWQRDMIDKLVEVAPVGNNIWYNYYNRIKGCNVILDYVDRVEGTQSEKDNLRGQALALRSYYYFTLVNLFGKPYNSTATDLGVPILLTADVSDAPMPRATVKEVYAQVEKDLLASIPLLGVNGKSNSVYKFNATASRLLLSRVYLYMGNWDASLTYSNEVIQAKPTLQQYNAIVPVLVPSATFAISYGATSPEVIWGYGPSAELSVTPFASAGTAPAKAGFSISESFLSTYDPADIRLTYSFRSTAFIDGSSIISYKTGSGKYFQGNPTISNGKAFRTAEAYLNRAEANIQKAIAGDASALTKALDDLNFLRSNRIKTANYTPITITDPQALYAFYQAERRRELCLEDHRWFDLRRWGMHEMSHEIQVVTGSPQTVTLEQNDSRYTLDVPMEALKRNPSLIQNP